VNIFIALNRAHHEQRALLEKLRETRKDLEKSVRIRDEFMSIVSHELKTPLTSLGLQVQLRQRLLSKGEMARFTPERLAKMFESDQKQIARIAHLIDDMLDISRISTGRLSINKDRFDLSELVKDLVEQTSEQFVASHCSVKVNAATPIIGNWDRFRIEQVVMNLLTNAMRYGCSKPILIEVTATASHARISVSDHGVGIEIKDLERIFERFERAVSGNEISGLGLGLYITKQILEAHQGSIRVESTLGLGSTFVVELPLRTAGDPPFEPDLANPVVVTDSIQ
jgi:signal transduction histidine kinase